MRIIKIYLSKNHVIKLIVSYKRINETRKDIAINEWSNWRE